MCVSNSGIILVFLSVAILSISKAHNILVLSPVTSHSHTNFFRPVVRALAERGHCVTYWNGIPPDQSIFTNKTTNLRVLYSPSLARINNHQTTIAIKDHGSPFRLLLGIPNRMETYCTAVYKEAVFHQLMNSTERFDLIIIEGIFNECVLPVVRKFDVPFVYMLGQTPPPWMLDALGLSLAFDHLPNPTGAHHGDEMNLWQRTYNTLAGMTISYFHQWFVMPVVDRLATEMLKLDNQTSVLETQSEYMSLVITNTHLSTHYKFPALPAIVEAGGLNCVKAKPLTEELESFVDGSGDAGFIVVSFGSILRVSDVPDDVRRLFLSTFGRLRQRVLWKWEGEIEHVNDTSIIPSNVKLMPWLPQQDLLGHPKIRLFVTHGGLNSIQEAVFHGIPLIALPVFSDQPVNAQKAQDDGYAIRLDWGYLTEEILFGAIQTILSDSRSNWLLFHPRRESTPSNKCLLINVLFI